MPIVWVYKPIGWTPKDCVDEYRRQMKETRKIAFAGRLDPMAYGLIPLIINDSQASVYSLQESHKTYQFKVILGITTDTYDILGLITNLESKILNMTELETLMNACSGITSQEYPPYSSKTVRDELSGKQVALWKLAELGRLPKELPKHPVHIEHLKLLKTNIKTIDRIVVTIINRLASLLPSHNLRHDEILATWLEQLSKFTEREFQVITCEARVSSGTYIRGLGNLMGGTCYDIHRTQYGDKISDIRDKSNFAILLT